MKLNKDQLKKMKEFLEYLNDNTTLKEKKSLVTLGSVDFLFMICTLYYLFEDTSQIETIMQSLGITGITTGILIAMITIYISKYEENRIIKKRIKRD